MAVTAIVDTVARRLTRAKLSEVEDRARRYILRHFADAGRAPGIPNLQRELQLASPEDAAAILISFFCSPEDLAAWRAAHPGEEGTILSLQEAVEAGQIIFGDMLR